MATIHLQNLSKTFGHFRAVDQVTLDVAEGEFLVLLGPSGCGKTTTLKMIAGFVEATSGSILIGGKDVTHVPPYRRNLGIVFQNYALFPHLSVFENVAFPLRRRKYGAAEIKKTVQESLELVQLDHLAGRLPRELSGGQQQRVAIARALSFRPDALLLDEPLSNLDAKLRLEVRQQIRRLQKRLGITTVMVTHDQDEAMSVADRLVVMNAGIVEQSGSSTEVYRQPANDFVASFIGSVNFLEGSVNGGSFRTKTGLQLPGSHLPEETRRVLIRPETVRVRRGSSDDAGGYPAQVLENVYLGAHSEIVVQLADGDMLTARMQNESDTEYLAPGDAVTCVIKQESVLALKS